MFQDLHRLGVSHIQVTFDGNASVTNARRRSRKITDVYGKTLSRLPMLAELSKLTIKLNFTPMTLTSIPEFMDDLVRVPSLTEIGFRIKPEPIVQYRPNIGKEINPDVEFGGNDPRLAKAFDCICRLAEQREIDIDCSAVFNTPCMAFRESSYLLEPDGSLRSCISAFGMDAFSVGNVFAGCDHERQSAALRRRVESLEACVKDNCVFLPMCGGGCPYEKLLATEEMDGLLCRRDYFISALPVLVRTLWRCSTHQLYLFA
jgi:uncharacterized protein